MGTTQPTVHAHRLPSTGRRPLRRLGAGLFTGAAASLTIALSPVVATPAHAGTTAAASTDTAPSPAADKAWQTANAQTGKAYQYGGAGPDSFDCSGLTQFAYASAGISLPHSSSGQSELGTPVDRANLAPGDLVFFYSPVSHVGIYVGNGQMVHAANESTGVEVTSVDMEGYNFARRIA
ncbi:C40 family peptidase [Blastococcus litoris]|uniref:C40 family peptidase n=1 Tax=Blastococcus litoris TaxID=2171622 RepID=UPI0030B84C83